MTVAELIEELKTMNPTATVVMDGEDYQDHVLEMSDIFESIYFRDGEDSRIYPTSNRGKRKEYVTVVHIS